MKKLLFILSTIISLSAFANPSLPSTSKMPSTAHGNRQMKYETMQGDAKTKQNKFMSSHYQPHYPAV